MHDHPLLKQSFSLSLSRREFLTQAGIAIGVAALPYAFTAAAQPSLPIDAWQTTHHAPVVSLHYDQPYIDMTGSAMPHLACCMTQAAWPLAAMSELQLRMQHPYL